MVNSSRNGKRVINRKPKIQNHRGKIRTEANLELAKEVKTNSEVFSHQRQMTARKITVRLA